MAGAIINFLATGWVQAAVCSGGTGDAVGDGAARASLEEYEHRLARALAQVINIIDPDVIVLGGGLSNCRRLYDTVPRIWSEFIFSDQVDTLLVPPQHGDSSGVRGAAKLWDSA